MRNVSEEDVVIILYYTSDYIILVLQQEHFICDSIEFNELLLLLTTIYKHALVKTIHVPSYDPNPWMIEEILTAKCKRRKDEHIYSRYDLSCQRHQFYETFLELEPGSKEMI